MYACSHNILTFTNTKYVNEYEYKNIRIEAFTI